MNYPKIFLFLLLSLVLSWLGLYIPGFLLEEGSIVEPLLQLFMYSWGPAAAVIILQKFVYQESFAKYGWNRKHYSFKWILATLFLPVAVIAGTVGSVFLLGNLMHLPGFGEVIMGDPAFTKELYFLKNTLLSEDLATWFSASIGDFGYEVFMPQEYWIFVLLILVIGMIAGATFNLVFNVGEEMGWRGFMVVETMPLGFLGSNLIIGGLWGLWNVPLVLHLVPDISIDVIWGIVALIGYSIAISFPMAYLSLKSRSIYASATFYGVMNNIGLISFFFIWNENPLFGSVKGLAGMLVFMAITYLIIRYDPKFVEEYKEKFY